jgi:hypothetical protein
VCLRRKRGVIEKFAFRNGNESTASLSRIVLITEKHKKNISWKSTFQVCGLLFNNKVFAKEVHNSLDDFTSIGIRNRGE